MGQLKDFFNRIFKKPEKVEIDDFVGEYGTDGIGDRGLMNESGVVRFFYCYDGTIGGDNFRYELQKTEDGRFVVKYETMEHSAYGEMTREVSEDFVKEIETLYRDCCLYKWDGYSKIDRGVCDGSGFSLRISFADGQSMSANGSNAVPEGYRAFKTRMMEIFEPVVSEMTDHARQKMIEKGFTGDCTSVLATFMKKGASGSDEYHILLRPYDGTYKNFEVRYKSESGEFFEKGKLSYYGMLPDEAVGFAKITELIKKYQVINWYDFQKTAEDYANAEWFQVSFSFEDTTISAMGTEYPENYAEFRREFLTLVKTAVENAIENFGFSECVREW